MSETIDGGKAARINAVSPSFCLAKWLQVTIDLAHGTNHSCHHPERHSVPLDELRRDPGALHNTSYKKKQRRMMLEGERPPECSYCWDIEDSGSEYSDRIIKSTDPWSFPKLDAVRGARWDADVSPTYVEIMLDDLCNFSCMYCMADVSTGVAEEMRRHGPYPVRNPSHRMPLHAKPEGENPYLAAFWKWLPSLLKELKVLRVTGGEPILSPRLGTLLDYLEANPSPALTLVLNSHLNHPARRLKPLWERISRMRSQGAIGGFELYTSADTHGAQAAYIRHGFDYPNWLSSVRDASEALHGCEIVAMCTFSILSLGGFDRFLEDVLALKRLNPAFKLDISYLRNPEYLRADMADDALLARLEGFIYKMKEHEGRGFSEHEIRKLENVAAWARRRGNGPAVRRQRSDFFRFIREYDRRKNRSFLEIFPEFRDFWIECKASILAPQGPTVTSL